MNLRLVSPPQGSTHRPPREKAARKAPARAKARAERKKPYVPKADKPATDRELRRQKQWAETLALYAQRDLTLTEIAGKVTGREPREWP